MIKDFFEKTKKRSGLLLVGVGIFLGLILIIADSTQTSQQTSDIGYSEHIKNYTENLEFKLECLINEISGISDSKVMITLKCGNEYVYASDDSDKYAKHVVVDGELVYVKEYLPEIEGVAIVCRGGNDAVNKSKVTDLVCSVLGLYSTHVYVTE